MVKLTILDKIGKGRGGSNEVWYIWESKYCELFYVGDRPDARTSIVELSTLLCK
jgi:hypothetical protein